MSAVLADDADELVISDLHAGIDVLSRLPLANPPRALGELHRFVDSMLESTLAADVLLDLLEHARISLCFVGEDLARRFVNKPLPLGEADAAIFRQVVDLWLKTARAYARCAQRQGGLDHDGADRLALILHRCLYYTGQALIEHQRARHELPAGLWLDLHGYYASAEEWGVATLPVPDSLAPSDRATHCTAAYACVLLIELAACYSLSLREQGRVRRLATLWAPLLGVERFAADAALPPLVIDLMHDSGLRAASECNPGGTLRRLDSKRIGEQLHHARTQLRHRVSPAQIGFGDDCSSAQCLRLIELLTRPWAQLRVVRKFRRHASAGIARVCCGFASIHYVLSGQVFGDPGRDCGYSRQQFDALFALRQEGDSQLQARVQHEQLDVGSDDWDVVNESANGFQLRRASSGRKLAHGQLIAICPHDGERFILAETTWLMQERSAALLAGVAALPGLPQAVAARPLPEAGRPERYERAFLLPAVAAVGANASLVAPPSWYHPGRIVEIIGSGRVRLIDVLQEGSDFARISYAPVG